MTTQANPSIINNSKIGHIATEYKPHFGGAETYITNLYKMLETEGFEQRVYQKDMGDRSPELVLIPRIPKWMRFKDRASELWAFNFLLPLKWGNLRKEDLLIVNYPFHYPPVRWHKKVIVISHGVEWKQPPDSLNHYLKKKIAKFTFDHAPYMVVNDTNYLREMGVDISPKQGMFSEVAKCRWFIPNCVDTTYFSPTAGLDNIKKMNAILVPRNISVMRGIHFALDAFAVFVKSYPDTNLIIAGSVPDYKYFSSLLLQIKKRALTGKVFFIGGVDYKMMPDLYSSSQISIIPTQYCEGTSLSALESMSCGVPVVATNVGGLPDLPSYNVDNEVHIFADAMKHVYSKRSEFSVSQQKEVRQNYNLSKWNESWLKVIRTALG